MGRVSDINNGDNTLLTIHLYADSRTEGLRSTGLPVNRFYTLPLVMYYSFLTAVRQPLLPEDQKVKADLNFLLRLRRASRLRSREENHSRAFYIVRSRGTRRMSLRYGIFSRYCAKTNILRVRILRWMIEGDAL